MTLNKRFRRAVRTCGLLCSSAALCLGQTVALDGFHNNETKSPDHYRWEGTKPGGFSEFGKLVESVGGHLTTIRAPVSDAALNGARVFIIVDPDTPSEAIDPKYLEPPEIAAIENWVESGGQLVLMGNDKGNAEFEHFNRLATRFGIQFREETYPNAAGKPILLAMGMGSIFGAGSSVYLVEVAPLQVRDGVQVLLADAGTPIMTLSEKGKGRVFAVGDPWLYNEYIDRYDNRKVGAALFRLLLGKP